VTVEVGQHWKHPDGHEVEVLEIGPAGPLLEPEHPQTKAVRVRNQQGKQAVFHAGEFVRIWEQVP
jgi:hypothetical protein